MVGPPANFRARRGGLAASASEPNSRAARRRTVASLGLGRAACDFPRSPRRPGGLRKRAQFPGGASTDRRCAGSEPRPESFRARRGGLRPPQASPIPRRRVDGPSLRSVRSVGLRDEPSLRSVSAPQASPIPRRREDGPVASLGPSVGLRDEPSLRSVRLRKRAQFPGGAGTDQRFARSILSVSRGERSLRSVRLRKRAQFPARLPRFRGQVGALGSAFE